MRKPLKDIWICKFGIPRLPCLAARHAERQLPECDPRETPSQHLPLSILHSLTPPRSIPHRPINYPKPLPSFLPPPRFQITSGDFTSHKSFLPDDQYGVCLDNIVKVSLRKTRLGERSPRLAHRSSEHLHTSLIQGCSDMIVRNPEGKILIGRRNVHPQPDWWYVPLCAPVPSFGMLEMVSGHTILRDGSKYLRPHAPVL